MPWGQRATLLILLTPDDTGWHVFKRWKIESLDGRQTERDSYISCSAAAPNLRPHEGTQDGHREYNVNPITK